MNDQSMLQAVAARFVEARKRRGLDIKQVAKLAGVHVNTISNLENAHSVPRPSTRAAIARALGEDIFDDGLAESARLGWSADVQAFTNTIGAVLNAMAPEDRSELVSKWMIELMNRTPRP